MDFNYVKLDILYYTQYDLTEEPLKKLVSIHLPSAGDDDVVLLHIKKDGYDYVYYYLKELLFDEGDYWLTFELVATEQTFSDLQVGEHYMVIAHRDILKRGSLLRRLPRLCRIPSAQ